MCMFMSVRYVTWDGASHDLKYKSWADHAQIRDQGGAISISMYMGNKYNEYICHISLLFHQSTLEKKL